VKRIVIAEDNRLFREGLKAALSGYEIVGEADDGQAAIELVQLKNPDLLILDLSMPKTSGFQVVETLKEQFRILKILVLSIHQSDAVLKKAIKAGVDGYCLKDEGREKIKSAIECVLEGGTYFSPGITNI
jgi:DNA-binding NarL/FixJ family response regulator